VNDSPQLARAPLVATIDALRTGEGSIAAYLDQTLARVARLDPRIHALVPEPSRQRRLLHEGTELQARGGHDAYRPALYGIVVGVKDCIRVDGLPTQAGSTLPPELFAGSQAAVVTALREAGALILGKTAMDEFAYAEPAATRNPHNLQHTPGGSSSGSAAAVAAGLCPLAIGTQTSRSVIGPAAFCGVVGYKPTYCRISTDGVISLAPSFDTIGMFTRDVAGMKLAASALVPNWRPSDERRRPVLGVPEGKLLTWTLESGRAAFAIHLRALSTAGYEIRRVPFFSDEAVEEVDHLALTLLHGEMARVHAAWFRQFSERYRPRTARAILRGQAVSDDELEACRAHRQRFLAQVETLMKIVGVDLWVTPASAGPAPLGLQLTGWGGMTTAWSYAGMPCATVPAGRDRNGLPFGLQCVAAPLHDESLLDWMEDIERVFTADIA
jgi:Asp-tRNA(Asn)/Glu-tRNA(Gln) amidotransferase A subunit family amidase